MDYGLSEERSNPSLEMSVLLSSNFAAFSFSGSMNDYYYSFELNWIISIHTSACIKECPISWEKLHLHSLTTIPYWQHVQSWSIFRDRPQFHFPSSAWSAQLNEYALEKTGRNGRLRNRNRKNHLGGCRDWEEMGRRGMITFDEDNDKNL